MTATAHTPATVRPKEFHFPLSVERIGPRHRPVHLDPEDFFVAAAASCLAVTFTGLAARAGLSYTDSDDRAVAGQARDAARASRAATSNGVSARGNRPRMRTSLAMVGLRRPSTSGRATLARTGVTRWSQ